jgi:hypothetical protein
MTDAPLDAVPIKDMSINEVGLEETDVGSLQRNIVDEGEEMLDVQSGLEEQVQDRKCNAASGDEILSDGVDRLKITDSCKSIIPYTFFANS